jgi:hypothetical protein
MPACPATALAMTFSLPFLDQRSTEHSRTLCHERLAMNDACNGEMITTLKCL